MAEPTQTPPREVSLEEAIAIAILFQKNDQLAEAEEVYCKILAVEPDHPDALHFAGVLAHQQGRSDEGIELIERSLQLAPEPGGAGDAGDARGGRRRPHLRLRQRLRRAGGCRVPP